MAIPADIDADAVAVAVRACPGVSTISTIAGPGTAPGPGDVEDAGPGRGLGPLMISYDHSNIDISVIAFYGHRPAEVTDQIERAIRPLIGTRHLTVTIEDLDTGHGPPTPQPPG